MYEFNRTFMFYNSPNMKKNISLVLILLFSLKVMGQSTQQFYTQDIDHFWNAYDSILFTKDKTKQLDYINRLYINKASDGLKAFLRGKEAPDLKWVNLITRDYAYLDSVRSRTLLVKSVLQDLQTHIDTLRFFYPKLKDAATYFIIGFRQQGGTIRNNLSIIGTEVIMQHSSVESLKNICIHEYVHTQQTRPADFRNMNVLTSSIREGSCDFITELILKQPLSAAYSKYGQENELLVWEVFKQDMLSNATDWWVSTGQNPLLPVRDLGYFVGYAICKSYYQSAKDKSAAVKDIIELDYSNPDSAIAFLQKSGYEQLLLQRGYDPSRALTIEGYSLKSTTIEFSFSKSPKDVIIEENGIYKEYASITSEPIKSVSIAGEFNKWNYSDSSFQLRKNGKGYFILKMQRTQLGQEGKKIPFDLIINNKYRVAPGFAVKNRELNDSGKMQLFIKL